MSHDRGCSCGKERYEYHECRDRECSRSPVYDPVYHQMMANQRMSDGIRGLRAADLERRKQALRFWSEP